jgi:drug/metabolite transporter (DMT)-like permease
MSLAGAWISVGLMIVLTVYAQVMLKMRVVAAGAAEPSLAGILGYLTRLLLDPLVISCFASGFLGALFWMVAISRLSLAVAYPFIALTIAAVVFVNAVVLGEPVRPLHIVGIVLIGAGLVAITQA